MNNIFGGAVLYSYYASQFTLLHDNRNSLMRRGMCLRNSALALYAILTAIGYVILSHSDNELALLPCILWICALCLTTMVILQTPVNIGLVMPGLPPYRSKDFLDYVAQVEIGTTYAELASNYSQAVDALKKEIDPLGYDLLLSLRYFKFAVFITTLSVLSTGMLL